MAIKVALQPLYSFLEANKDKKISTVFGDIETLCTSNKGGGGGGNHTIYDSNDTATRKPVLQFCNQALRYCALVGEKAVPFGIKVQNASGLNGSSVAGAKLYSQHITATQKLERDSFQKIIKASTETDDEGNPAPSFTAIQANEAVLALQKKQAQELATYRATTTEGFIGERQQADMDSHASKGVIPPLADECKAESLALGLAYLDSIGQPYVAPLA